MPPQSVHSRLAFTLTEMLVTIAICAVVMALLLPAVQAVRQAAARVACASQMRQVALGVHLYSDTYLSLPVGCGYPRPFPIPRPALPGVSWHTAILPYVEQESLARQARTAFLQDPSGESSAHQAVRAVPIPIFQCPSESIRFGTPPPGGGTWSLTSYQGVAGTGKHILDGVFHPDLTIRMNDIQDGTSNTLIIGERPAGPHGYFSGWYSTWGNCVCPISQLVAASLLAGNSDSGVNCPPLTEFGPLRAPVNPGAGCDLYHFWSTHSRGANFAFADGGVRFLTYNANSILPDLATRAGGEVVELP